GASGVLVGQNGGGPPTHTPPAQVSAVVQALPSVQAAVFGVFTQPVAGSHESSVQTLASLQLEAGPPTQTPPAQVSAVVQALPSSQCSPGSRKPFPQIEAFFPRTDQRFVSTPPGGSPGPSTRKKFVPHGLPVIVCNTAGSPMNPAGGAGGVASHWSQVLTKENGASGVVKALNPVGDAAPQVAGTERRQSSVKLMLRRPGPAACRTWTPKGWVIV